MSCCVRVSCVVFLLSGTLVASAQAETVEEVLATSHGGNIHENLMALGVEAVPDLCEALLTHAYSTVIIQALHELGDPRAAECLEAYIKVQIAERADDSEWSHSWDLVIQALRDLGDASQVPRMKEIFRDESVALNTRMQAAATLCHFSEGALRDDAKAFIFEMLERFPEMYRRRNVEPMGVMPEHLLEALWFVGSEESERALVDQISNPMAIYLDQKAIPYVAKLDRLDAAEALAWMAGDPIQEPHVRVMAAEGLQQSPRFEESGADVKALLADHEEWAHWLEGVWDYPERLQALLE